MGKYTYIYIYTCKSTTAVKGDGYLKVKRMKIELMFIDSLSL